MIVVRVELHSAVTGRVTELGRMIIANQGTPGALRDYRVFALRGRAREALDALQVQRHGAVLGWPSPRAHVWNLVAEALRCMGYGRNRAEKGGGEACDG